MKSAYELAMERLNKSAPAVKLSAAQKARLAELDSIHSAKLAEREILLKGEMEKAAEAGDVATMEQIQKQFQSDRKSIQSDLEAKKDKVRNTPEKA